MRVEGRVGTTAPLDSPTLIYDGACGFCQRWALRAKALDRASRVRSLPLQDPSAPELAGVPRDRLMLGVHFVRPDGEVFAGAAAARELAHYLSGGWLLRAVFALPGGLRVGAWIYAWIAGRWGPLSRLGFRGRPSYVAEDGCARNRHATRTDDD